MGEIVPADVLAKLQRVTSEFQEASRAVVASGDVFDVGPGHGPDDPALRRRIAGHPT
ncbi:MAG: hypothetical protein AAFU61_15215 [Pseudomonadota bacterium]